MSLFQNSKYETVTPNAQKRQNLIWSTTVILLLVACLAVIAWCLKHKYDKMPIYTLVDDGELMFIDGVELPDGKATR